MKANFRTYIAIILGVVIIAGIVIYFNSLSNWNETYDMKSEQPYGLDVISNLLRNKVRNENFHVTKQLGDSSIQHFSQYTHMNYVFIGDRYYADSNDIKNLYDFVGRGNTAFLSSNNFPAQITALMETETVDTTGGEEEYYNNNVFSNTFDTIAKLNFPGRIKSPNDFILKYNYQKLVIPYNWTFIDSSVFDVQHENISVLGTMNQKISYVRISYGRGNLYIHTTPIAFTNYFIVADNGRDYSERALSVLNEGPILWDEFNKLPKYNYGYNGDDMETNSQGPLMYILSRDSLRWAWYLLLAMFFLYAIFFGKRRQRVIPLLAPNKNTSLEYVKTVDKLYYLERDHRAVCLQKMKHFHTFLKNRYFILSTHRNEEMIDKVSMVSGVNREFVSDIFNQFALINAATELTDDEFIRFHQSLSKFYKECI